MQQSVKEMLKRITKMLKTVILMMLTSISSLLQFFHFNPIHFPESAYSEGLHPYACWNCLLK